MTDVADTICHGCRTPVFERGSVVLCGRCDAYQHLGCWSESGRCRATPKCKGKPVPVAVVKLQAAGPTAEQIAELVETRTQEILHPLVADLRSEMAHHEDVEALRKQLAQSNEAAEARVETLRRDLETRTEKIRQLVAAVDARVAAVPAGLDRNDLARTSKEIREGLDAALKQSGPSVDTQLADLRRAISSELHGVLMAIEACRWDTGSRRHPLPWDGRTDDVLAPRTAGGARE
jgi:hypothetical protein